MKINLNKRIFNNNLTTKMPYRNNYLIIDNPVYASILAWVEIGTPSDRITKKVSERYNITESAVRLNINKLKGKPIGRSKIRYPFILTEKRLRRNVQIYNINRIGIYNFMIKHYLSKYLMETPINESFKDSEVRLFFESFDKYMEYCFHYPGILSMTEIFKSYLLELGNKIVSSPIEKDVEGIEKIEAIEHLKYACTKFYNDEYNISNKIFNTARKYV